MGETGALKERVEYAIGRLVESNDERKAANHSLIDLLSNLEVKYEARHEEVSYSRARIEELERDNRKLTDLLNKVVALMEQIPNEADGDPLFEATEMARRMVAEWDDTPARPRATESPKSRPGSAARGGDADPDPWEPQPDERVTATRVSDRDVFDNVVHLNFDDVPEEELEVERLLDSALEPGNLPTALVTAIAAYREMTGVTRLDMEYEAEPEYDGEDADLEAPATLSELEADEIVSYLDDAASLRAENAEDLDADIDIPSHDAPEPAQLENRDLDIRAMLARIEEAAARATTRADKDLADKPAQPARKAAFG